MSGRMRVMVGVVGLAMGQGALGQSALDPRLDSRGPQALWGGSAAAQPARPGRLLDNSLYEGNRYNDAPAANDPMREFAFRRAIVTGNAGGGLAFRGDVGYSDARAFRADLGSNDLFAYRRDSLYSGLVGQGIRGTEAIQYQMALTTGSAPPPNLVGSVVVPRAFTPAPVVTPRSHQPETQVPIGRPDPSDGEESGTLMGTLRTSAAYSTTMGMQPVLVNKLDTPADNADIAVTASALRGLRVTPVPDESQDWRPGQELDTRVPGLEIDPGAVVTAHDEVMRRLEEQALREEQGEVEEGDAPQPIWRQRLEELRLRLQQGEPEEGEEDPKLESPNVQVPNDFEGVEQLGTFDEQTLELMRQAQSPVDRLVSPTDATRRDAFLEHMETGQRLLTRERFFDAEERFTRALAVRPGDVTAQVGRIHAQLGAGMYLSASMNLRALIMQHPELVAMRFDASLLPGDERRDQIAEALRKRIGIGEDRDSAREGDPQLRREAGLLLAYLGRQTDNPRALREGLDAMRSVNEQAPDDESQATERRLLELLERVWLNNSSDE